MIEYAPMTPADIPEALALWRGCAGVGLRDADAPEPLTRYLERNPGTSFVARAGPALVGAALAGHDGRRGFLYHVAVAPAHRRCGIGGELVGRCLAALKDQGIMKCQIWVFADNKDGREFWSRGGWQERTDLRLMSFTRPGFENA